MAKTWVLKETGEFRIPRFGEWVNDGHPVHSSELDFLERFREYPILSLTVYDDDPMERIREVYQKWKEKTIGRVRLPEEPFYTQFEIDMWQAIKKFVEGK